MGAKVKGLSMCRGVMRPYPYLRSAEAIEEGAYGCQVSKGGCAIAVVAAGYSGDMDEELCNELTTLTFVAPR